jgi:hypothetical protein
VQELPPLANVRVERTKLREQTTPPRNRALQLPSHFHELLPYDLISHTVHALPPMQRISLREET